MSPSKARKPLPVVRGAAIGMWELGKDVVRRLARARASEAAATMAYYALLSLFPLLLVLVVAGSFVLESDRAFHLVVDTVGNVLPGSRTLIEENVQRVIKLRGPVGLLGLITLIWSASSFFSLLSHNIEQAWVAVSPRSVVHRRLVALAMVVGLALLMVLSLLANAVLEGVRQGAPAGGEGTSGLGIWTTLSSAVPWLLTFLMFLSLYRWLPSPRVSWRGAAWGAGVATALWQLAGRGFVWYLESGLARYELVYGSIGAVVVLMLWIYVAGWVTLAGAHLSAAIGQRKSE